MNGTLDCHKDVFIVYSSEDVTFVQKDVITSLKNNGISCLDHEKDFIAGLPVIENIQRAVRNTRKTLIVLTQNSLQSSWVNFETMLALEKTALTGRAALCYLLCDVKKDEIPKLKVFSNAIVVELDCNKDDWMSKLIENVKDDQTIESLLPAGNLAVGQVWSHWSGFQKVVIPELKKKIRESDFYRLHSGRMPVKFFELIPLSCKIYDNLSVANKKIKYVGKILIQKEPKEYQVSVYNINGEDEHPYYFICGYPNVLKVIRRLETEEQWLDTSRRTSNRISGKERQLQVWRFYHTMNHLLNHPMNRPCNNMVRLLVYDDAVENHSLYTLLLEAIKEELLKTSNHHLGNNGFIRQKSKLQWLPPHTKDKTKRVCIVADDQSQTDQETKWELHDLLIKEGYEVIEFPKTEQPEITSFSECLDIVQWVVFLFSKDTLKIDNLHRYLFNMTLHDNVEKNKLHVIPVLIDVPYDTIPEDLAWVTYIKKEKHYQKRLIGTLRCEDIAVDCIVPAMDVTTGLAWAFVLNYLVMKVPVYVEWIYAQFGHCKDHPLKIYLLIPDSCDTRTSINLSTDSDNFKSFKTFEEKGTLVAGTNRNFDLSFYTVVQGPQKGTVVGAQMVATIGCLLEMSQKECLSGLNPMMLHDEVRKFYQLTKKILEESIKAVELKLAESVVLLHYNDKTRSPASAIIDALTQNDI